MGTRAVGYFQEDEDEGGPAVPAAGQSRAFLEFCRRADADVAATFVDRGPAGAPRPGFHQLLDYLRRAAPRTLVVVDALGRLGSVREAALRCFAIMALGGELAIADRPDDALDLLIEGWANRGARDRLSERVRDAMRRKAVKGEVLGRPPYGYRVGARRRLEIAPDEAAVVRYIFRLYVQDGLGIRLIARRLNEEGYRTRRGGNWSMVTIRDILRNRAYLGTYARFGVRVPGSHTALIASDEFRKAQERMAERRTAGGPRNVSPFVLSGLACCGACGHRMIGVSRRQSWQRRTDGGLSSAEYRYYQCGSRTNQSVCAYHTQRADALDEAVRRAAMDELARRLREPDTVPPPAAAGGESATDIRVRRIEREADRLMDQAAEGRLERDQLVAAGMELGRRYLQLEDRLSAGEHGPDGSGSRRGRLQAALSRLRDEWAGMSPAERHDLLDDLLERVDVHDDRVEPVLRD